MKTVICGLWHVHAGMYYKEAAQHSEILGVWDDDPKRLAAFAEKYSLRAFASFDELLASGADSAVVCTSSDTHRDVIVALADAGIDVFTEKVLALTSAQCDDIEKAIDRNGVRFVISYPHKYSPLIRAVKAVADSGELGKLNYFRFRNVHDGASANWLPRHFYDAAQCGGGAMIDLGAHGMYLADWFLGMPQSVASVFTRACTNPDANLKNADRLEDNAVSVLTYPDGAIALNETGFVSKGCPMTLEVAGEDGWVRSDNNTVVKRTRASGSAVEVPVGDPLPAPITQFFTGNILPGCGIKEAKNLTKLMEMAYANVINR